MASTDKITPAEARVIAEENGVSVSIVTMHEWCKDRGIGTKIAGRWYVNKKRLMWLLEGREWQKNDKDDKKK